MNESKGRKSIKITLKRRSLTDEASEEANKIEESELASEETPSEPKSEISVEMGTCKGIEMDLIGFESKDEGSVYFCWKCDYPVVRYGRISPCRHVFCADCSSSKRGWRCPRCKESASEIKQISKGPLYICIFGGTHLQDKRSCLRGYETWTRALSHVQKRHEIGADVVENYLVEAFFASDEKLTVQTTSLNQTTSLINSIAPELINVLVNALAKNEPDQKQETLDSYDSTILDEG
ncbi:hypothetical protein ACOME3_005500 [Neoechinorhynchus agilis]